MTTILITGAARGLGREMASQALSRGWRVYGSVRHEQTAPDGVIELPFDVTDREAIQAASGRIAEPIDILVNNAGVIGPARQSVFDMDADGFARTLAINTIGPVLVTQAFLERLSKGKNPRLVTISSWMGSLSHAKSDRIAYRASKAAINRIVRAMATELLPRGITAVSMHPGWVKTDMGGSAADITPQQSVSGILSVVDRLTLADTDQFINWDGTRLDW